ncbi:retrovirus-related Pol polyprotein from transposon 297 [Trichonephila clavipes]|nr:retrovirus-related Pol polyprotein from transposon 297 [Trichonephila clavipes]
MPLHHFRKQYQQRSQFEKGRIIGMREARWSTGRVDHRIICSDYTVGRFRNQWILEMSFTQRPGSGRPRQTTTSNKSRFNLSSDDNRVRVWRPRGECLNLAFALQRHTAPTAGVMDIYQNLVLIIHVAPDASHVFIYAHKSFECRRANLNNTSTPPSAVNAVHELPSPINMCKDVTIFGSKLRGRKICTNFKAISYNANENFIMTISDGSPTFHIGPNISQHNPAEVEQLLSTYTPKKTKTVNIELDIALTNDEPIFHKPRRLPFAERDIVDAQVDEWVKNGIVEPCSSPYASQVVVVKKKDGKSRVCIDYRRLNRKLIKDNCPLPLIDDILDCLQNAKICTTLDLKNGFFHVAVNERSRKFTSFVTHNGQYQFRRMPFGLSTCPSTFMRYINAIFRHLISKSIVLPYMDDVVIPAANESQAFEYLKIVLQVGCDYGLEINFKKCQFLHNKIKFLGHIIENGSLFPSPSKTKAVIYYPDLKNIKDVRRFLGLTGYFRKFLPSYSTIAKPLSDLLRKDSLFQFYAEQQTAFQKLKYLLSQQPVLSIFNQSSPTEIHTDASIDGLGAVLLQKSIHDNQFHPVFYMSKKDIRP